MLNDNILIGSIESMIRNKLEKALYHYHYPMYVNNYFRMVLSRIKVRNVMGNVYYIFHALLNSAGAKIISRDVKSSPNKLKAYENLHAYNLWVTSRYYICFVCKKTTTQKMRMLLQCVLYIERFHFIYAFVC